MANPITMRLELVAVPVSDTDRAKTFYVEQVGFHEDVDTRVNPELRFVQLTPPGSGCSISFGEGISPMAPGSLKGLQLVVDDVAVARDELRARGLETGEIDVQPWGSFIYFADPDGNEWAIQQLPDRDASADGSP